jgi:hypothetical protein
VKLFIVEDDSPSLSLSLAKGDGPKDVAYAILDYAWGLKPLKPSVLSLVEAHKAVEYFTFCEYPRWMYEEEPVQIRVGVSWED